MEREYGDGFIRALSSGGLKRDAATLERQAEDARLIAAQVAKEARQRARTMRWLRVADVTWWIAVADWIAWTLL